MNIFYLSQDPNEAALMLCDKHVGKLLLEGVQMLSTAHRVLDGTKVELYGPPRKKTVYSLEDRVRDCTLYKAAHVNHPCSVWVRTTYENYHWLYRHCLTLSEEFKYRFGKVHKSSTLLNILEYAPNMIKAGPLTVPALAMPELYRTNDPVYSYRLYYIKEKSKIAKWERGRKPPSFMVY